MKKPIVLSMVADASWMPCDNFSEDWPRSTVVQKKVLHKSGSKLDKYTCRENAKGERKNGIEGRANDSKSNEGVLNFQNMSQPAIFLSHWQLYHSWDYVCLQPISVQYFHFFVPLLLQSLHCLCLRLLCFPYCRLEILGWQLAS